MIYRMMPERYKNKMESLLEYSGSNRRPERFITIAFLMSVVVGLIFGALSGGLFLIVFVLVFIGMFGLVHGFLILAVERRARFVESILPDALQLMAANSRAGYIPTKALMLSARKEFGPLSEAIKKAGKELMTGKNLDESLLSISKTIKSDIL